MTHSFPTRRASDLRSTTALDWANASGLNHMNPGICRLAVALTPYWKWRRLGNRLLLQRGGLRFQPGEIHEILSNLLEHTRAMVPMKTAAVVDSSAESGRAHVRARTCQGGEMRGGTD